MIIVQFSNIIKKQISSLLLEADYLHGKFHGISKIYFLFLSRVKKGIVIFADHFSRGKRWTIRKIRHHGHSLYKKKIDRLTGERADFI